VRQFGKQEFGNVILVGWVHALSARISSTSTTAFSMCPQLEKRRAEVRMEASARVPVVCGYYDAVTLASLTTLLVEG
jgi:hypothetical protein